MTFDEWIKSLRSTGHEFTSEQKTWLRCAWEASRNVALLSPTYAPRPAGEDKCQAFDAQEEIAKLREELNEIRASLEMPPGANLSSVTNEIEPEVSAGEGFNIHERVPYRSVANFHNWRNSKVEVEELGRGFNQRCADLEAEGFDADSAFALALDESHGRKPKFPGY